MLITPPHLAVFRDLISWIMARIKACGQWISMRSMRSLLLCSSSNSSVFRIKALYCSLKAGLFIITQVVTVNTTYWLSAPGAYAGSGTVHVYLKTGWHLPVTSIPSTGVYVGDTGSEHLFYRHNLVQCKVRFNGTSCIDIWIGQITHHYHWHLHIPPERKDCWARVLLGWTIWWNKWHLDFWFT